MKINLNGKTVETHSLSLLDLVEEQGLNPLSLIAEYNSSRGGSHIYHPDQGGRL